MTLILAVHADQIKEHGGSPGVRGVTGSGAGASSAPEASCPAGRGPARTRPAMSGMRWVWMIFWTCATGRLAGGDNKAQGKTRLYNIEASRLKETDRTRSIEEQRG